MENAKNKTPKNEAKVKRGEELLVVLKEILADGSKVLDAVGKIEQRLDAIESKVGKPAGPFPGKWPRC